MNLAKHLKTLLIFAVIISFLSQNLLWAQSSLARNTLAPLSQFKDDEIALESLFQDLCQQLRLARTKPEAFCRLKENLQLICEQIFASVPEVAFQDMLLEFREKLYNLILSQPQLTAELLDILFSCLCMLSTEVKQTYRKELSVADDGAHFMLPPMSDRKLVNFILDCARLPYEIGVTKIHYNNKSCFVLSKGDQGSISTFFGEMFPSITINLHTHTKGFGYLPEPSPEDLESYREAKADLAAPLPDLVLGKSRNKLFLQAYNAEGEVQSFQGRNAVKQALLDNFINQEIRMDLSTAQHGIIVGNPDTGMPAMNLKGKGRGKRKKKKPPKKKSQKGSSPEKRLLKRVLGLGKAISPAKRQEAVAFAGHIEKTILSSYGRRLLAAAGFSAAEIDVLTRYVRGFTGLPIRNEGLFWGGLASVFASADEEEEVPPQIDLSKDLEKLKTLSLSVPLAAEMLEKEFYLKFADITSAAIALMTVCLIYHNSPLKRRVELRTDSALRMLIEDDIHPYAAMMVSEHIFKIEEFLQSDLFQGRFSGQRISIYNFVRILNFFATRPETYNLSLLYLLALPLKELVEREDSTMVQIEFINELASSFSMVREAEEKGYGNEKDGINHKYYVGLFLLCKSVRNVNELQVWLSRLKKKECRTEKNICAGLDIIIDYFREKRQLNKWSASEEEAHWQSLLTIFKAVATDIPSFFILFPQALDLIMEKSVSEAERIKQVAEYIRRGTDDFCRFQVEEGMIFDRFNTATRADKGLREMLADFIQEDDQVISIGCSDGFFESILNERWQKNGGSGSVIGLERAASFAALARRRGVDIIEADAAEPWPVAPSSKSKVLFLESIGGMDLARVFANANRVLEPKGEVIITSYEISDPINDCFYYGYRERKDIIESLTGNGFKVTDVSLYEHGRGKELIELTETEAKECPNTLFLIRAIKERDLKLLHDAEIAYDNILETLRSYDFHIKGKGDCGLIAPEDLPLPRGPNIGVPIGIGTDGHEFLGIEGKDLANYICFLPTEDNLYTQQCTDGSWRVFLQYGVYFDQDGALCYGKFRETLEIHALTHGGTGESAFFANKEFPLLNPPAVPALTEDKGAMKDLCKKHGIRTSEYMRLRKEDGYSDTDLRAALSSFIEDNEITDLVVKPLENSIAGRGVKMFSCEPDEIDRAVEHLLRLYQKKSVIIERRMRSYPFNRDSKRQDWNIRAMVNVDAEGKMVLNVKRCFVRYQDYGNQPVNMYRGAETIELAEILPEIFAEEDWEDVWEDILREAEKTLAAVKEATGSVPGLLGLDFIIGEDKKVYLIEANSGTVGGYYPLVRMAEGDNRTQSLRPLVEYLARLGEESAQKQREASADAKRIFYEIGNDPVLLSNIGKTYAQVKEYQQAISYLEHSLEVDDGYVEACLSLGLVYYELEDYQQAISCWQEVTGFYEDFIVDTWYWLGLAYKKLDDLEQARHCLETFLQFDDRSAKGWSELGAVCGQLEDFPASIACFRRVTELVSKEQELYQKAAEQLVELAIRQKVVFQGKDEEIYAINERISVLRVLILAGITDKDILAAADRKIADQEFPDAITFTYEVVKIADDESFYWMDAVLETGERKTIVFYREGAVPLKLLEERYGVTSTDEQGFMIAPQNAALADAALAYKKIYHSLGEYGIEVKGKGDQGTIAAENLAVPEGVNVGVPLGVGFFGNEFLGVEGSEQANFIYFLPAEDNLHVKKCSDGSWRVFVKYGVYFSADGALNFGQFKEPLELHALTHGGTGESAFFADKQFPLLNSTRLYDLTMDKAALKHFAGVSVPEYLLCAREEEHEPEGLETMLADFLSGNEITDYVIKPRYGVSGRGVRLFQKGADFVEALDYLSRLYEKEDLLIERRVISYPYMKGEKRKDWNIRALVTVDSEGEIVLKPDMCLVRYDDFGGRPVNMTLGAELAEFEDVLAEMFTKEEIAAIWAEMKREAEKIMLALREEIGEFPGLIGIDFIVDEEKGVFAIEINGGENLGGFCMLAEIREGKGITSSIRPVLEHLVALGQGGAGKEREAKEGAGSLFYKIGSDLYAWLNKGWTYMLGRDYQRARECFFKAVAVEDNYSTNYYSLGCACYELGEYREAVGHFEKVISFAEDNLAESWYYLELIAEKGGDLPEAERCLKEAIENNSDYAQAWFDLARAQFKLGKHDQSKASGLKVTKMIVPRDPLFRKALDFVYSVFRLDTQLVKFRSLLMAGETDANKLQAEIEGLFQEKYADSVTFDYEINKIENYPAIYLLNFKLEGGVSQTVVFYPKDDIPWDLLQERYGLATEEDRQAAGEGYWAACRDKKLTDTETAYDYILASLRHFDIAVEVKGDIGIIDKDDLSVPQGLNIGCMLKKGISMSEFIGLAGHDLANFIYFFPGEDNLYLQECVAGDAQAFLQYGVFFDRTGALCYGKFREPLPIYAFTHGGIGEGSALLAENDIPLLNAPQIPEITEDKKKMNDLCQEEGIRGARSVFLSSEKEYAAEDIREILAGFIAEHQLTGFVVKPRYGFGARAVKMFAGEEIEEAVDCVFKLYQREDVIIEERINSYPYSVADKRQDWNIRAMVAFDSDGQVVLKPEMCYIRYSDYGMEPVSNHSGAKAALLEQIMSELFGEEEWSQIWHDIVGAAKKTAAAIGQAAGCQPGLLGLDIIIGEDKQVYLLEANSGDMIGGFHRFAELREGSGKTSIGRPIAEYLAAIAGDYAAEGRKAKEDAERIYCPLGDEALIWLNAGQVYLNFGNYRQAERCYRKGITIDDGITQSYYDLGIVCRKLGKYKEAIAHFRHAISFAGEYLKESWYQLGLLYAEIGKPEKAGECLERVLDLDKDHISALYRLGYIYLELKQFKKARVRFEQVKGLVTVEDPLHTQVENLTGFLSGLIQSTPRVEVDHSCLAPNSPLEADKSPLKEQQGRVPHALPGAAFLRNGYRLPRSGKVTLFNVELPFEVDLLLPPEAQMVQVVEALNEAREKELLRLEEELDLESKNILVFQKMILLLESYLRNHSVPNAIDAIYEAAEEAEDFYTGKIEISIQYDFSAKVLSLAISDNGVGIERRMFEYWKDRYPVFNRAYYFKSLSTKMAKSLIGHFGDGVVYFLWPSEDYDFCHSHGCFLADGAFSFHHEIEFRSRKKGCPGYSLLVPNPVNGVREEFVLTEPAEDIPLGTTVSLNIRLQTKDDIAKLRKVFYDGDRLDVEKVFLQLDMVRNNSDSISRSL